MLFTEPLESRRLLSRSHIAPPAAPSNLAATPVEGTPAIRLTWTDNSSKQTGIIVERKKGRSGAWVIVADLVGDPTYYRDAHLAEGTAYTYRVGAYNRGGDSAFTAQATAETWLPDQPILDSAFGAAGNALVASEQGIGAIAPSPDAGVIYAATDGYASDGTKFEPVIAAFTSSGAVDRAFGTKSEIVVNALLPTPITSIAGIAVQSDGKIVIAGKDSSDAIVVARFNSDGTLDTTFAGGTGELVAPFDGEEFVTTMTLASDGSIYVGGMAEKNESGLNNQDLFAVHVTADGSVDTSYGTNGILIGDHQNVQQNATVIGTQFESAQMAFDPTSDSVVFAADYAIVDNMGSTGFTSIAGAHFESDGTIDPLFVDASDGNGNLQANQVIVDASGKILVVGCEDNESLALRFNSDGTQDSTWTGPPAVLQTNSDSIDYAEFDGIAQLADGSYIVVGIRSEGHAQALVAHLSASDGSLIGSYVFDVPSGEANSIYQSVSIDPAGSIFAAGSLDPGLLLSEYQLPG